MNTAPWFRFAARLLAGALLLATASFGLAQDKTAGSSASAVMDSTTQHVIAILRDPHLSAEQKRDQVKQIAYVVIDFPTMARLSLGPPWRTITDDQRARYSQVFKAHVTDTYGHLTDDYTNEDVNITGDQKESDGDDTVHSSVLGESNGTRQEVAKVDYRLRQHDGQWKIIDITVDGVSLVATFRSQFQEVMANGGIEQLIKVLQQKVTANDK